MANITNVTALQLAVEYLAKTEFPVEQPEVFAKLQHMDEVNRKNRKSPSITPDVIAQVEQWVLAQPMAQTAKQVGEQFEWTSQRASMVLRSSSLQGADTHNGKTKVKIYGNADQIEAAQEHYLAICQAKAAEKAAKAQA